MANGEAELEYPPKPDDFAPKTDGGLDPLAPAVANGEGPAEAKGDAPPEANGLDLPADAKGDALANAEKLAWVFLTGGGAACAMAAPFSA